MSFTECAYYIEKEYRKSHLRNRMGIVFLCEKIKADFLIRDKASRKPYLLLFEVDVYDEAIKYVKDIIDNKKYNPKNYNQDTIISLKKQKDDFLKEIGLFNNSSIWIRIAPLHDDKLKKKIEKEFETYTKLGLYSQEPSQENFEYQLRSQNANYLDARFSNAHSHYITPTLYHDELQCANNILSINTESDETKRKYPEIARFHDVTLRILLIDDKDEKGGQIAQLMSLEVFDADNKLYDKTVWKDNGIMSYFFTYNDKYNRNIFDLSKDKTSSNVQIIQVTNLADAIQLLSDESIRFDLILLDYLLGKKKDDENDRQLSTDFFIWFQDKHGENTSVDYLRIQLWEKVYPKEENKDEIKYKDRDELLDLNKQLRERIKSNRGPLRKLWIFPITAFNQTLIDDLTNNNVRLIDYYWHISKGADPVTTPYLFLRMLNSFLYLQLEESVFLEHEIKKFLIKSIRRLRNVEKPEDFAAEMGSDYTEFVQNFMNRSIIYRDKVNNSLFANYIWEKFYINPEYKNQHILVNYIHRFYHRCTFGGKNDFHKMILFWREMKMFITNNFPEWTNDNNLDLDVYFEKINEVFPKL